MGLSREEARARLIQALGDAHAKAQYSDGSPVPLEPRLEALADAILESHVAMGRWEPTYKEKLKAWKAKRDQLGGKVHCGGEDCEKCVDNDEEHCDCWCDRCGPLNAWLDAKPEKPEESSQEGSSPDVWIMFAVSGIRVWRSLEEATKDLQGAAFASVERYVPSDNATRLKELLRRAIVDFIEPMGISHLTKDTQWRTDADAFIKECLPLVFGKDETVFGRGQR
jgi:hypothetical protein